MVRGPWTVISTTEPSRVVSCSSPQDRQVDRELFDLVFQFLACGFKFLDVVGEPCHEVVLDFYSASEFLDVFFEMWVGDFDGWVVGGVECGAKGHGFSNTSFSFWM